MPPTMLATENSAIISSLDADFFRSLSSVTLKPNTNSRVASNSSAVPSA